MAFATADELETYAGLGLTEARAQLLLDIATSTIQSFTAQTLLRVAADVAVLPGSSGSILELPERPVISVATVAIDGETLSAADWQWDGQSRLYRGGILDGISINAPHIGTGCWGGLGAQVTVTYTHGFDPLPNDLKGLCLAMVQRAVANPGGITAESVGSYSVSYGAQNGVYITADEQATVQRYRKTHS